MKFVENVKKVFTSVDLRKKIFFVFGILVITRVLTHIPMPGVNLDTLRSFFDQNAAFGMLNLFTGGAMRNFSIVLMGVGPYITSSIIFQLLTMVIPQLEALSKEGEHGREKINHYTRICTVPLAAMQSYAMLYLLKNQGVLPTWSTFQLITMIISLSAGTILLMWLGELISEQKIGNGISFIIALGIISGTTTKLAQTFATADSTKIISMIIFAILTVLVVAGIVFINDGQRQIPITYARRVRGAKSYGGFETYLPIRVALAGVIPIIFALSLMVMPSIIAKFLEQAKSAKIVDFGLWISHVFSDNLYYGIIYFVLVVAFTFFYTSVIFKPQDVSENLQKRGGFIPGVRPGNETASYLANVSSKITFIGAIFLALIAVLPYIVQSLTSIQTLALGGTGILIVISVILETRRQLESQIIMRKYDNY